MLPHSACLVCPLTPPPPPCRHFTEFLERFFELHSRYTTTDSSGVRKTRPLYFTGESHAGHYIPNMIQHLLERNAKAQPGQLFVDVRGAAMGNPWVDPPSQVCACAREACPAGALPAPRDPPLTPPPSLFPGSTTCRSSRMGWG